MLNNNVFANYRVIYDVHLNEREFQDLNLNFILHFFFVFELLRQDIKGNGIFSLILKLMCSEIRITI